MMRLGKWLSYFHAPYRKGEEAAPGGDPESRKRLARFPILALICLGLAIVGGSYLVFEELKRNETQNIKDNLASVARLKSSQINDWLSQSRATAEIFSKHSQLANVTNQWLSTGALPDPTATWLTERIEQIRRIYAFDEVAILNVDGTVLLTTSKATQRETQKDEHLALIRATVGQRRTLVGQLQWDIRMDGTPFISLPVAAPIIAANENGKVTGVFLTELDASQFLFPLIQTWPIPSQSAESLLVRRDGDDVLYLNELRHRKGTALAMRIPVDHPTVLASQALRGSSGLILGTDYRDEHAVGYALQVPGTDWVMIAKIDEREAYGLIRQLGRNIAFVGFLMLTITVLSFYYWWRQRNTAWEKSHAQQRAAQLEAELHQQKLSKQFDYLTRHANDIILLMDEAGNVVEANERAVAVYGYSRQELLEKNIRQLRLSHDISAMEKQFELVKLSDSLLFESEHIRSDGSAFPVEVNSRVIQTEKGMFVQSIIRDITERKRAEEALRESEARFTLLAETAEALLVTADPQGLVEELCRKVMLHLDCDVFFNFMVDEAERRLRLNACAGIPEEEARKIKWLDYGVAVCGCVARDCQRMIAENISQMSDARTELVQSYGVQAYCCHPLMAGERLIGTLSFGATRRARFSDEDVELMQAVSHQVSVAMERILREEALMESEERYRSLVLASAQVVWTANTRGEVMMDIPAWHAYTGQSAEESQGFGWMNAILPEDRERVAETWRKASDARTVYEVQYMLRRHDGAWRNVVARGVPIFDPDGSVREYVGTCVDITESKLAEEALRESEEKFRSSFANAAIGFAMTEPDGSFLDCNPAYSRITGYSVEELRAQDFPELIHPDDYDENMKLLGQLVAGDISDFVIESRYVRKNGELVWVRKSVTTVRQPSGEPRWIIALVEDITERKRIEAELRESEERLNRAQEMAHLGSWELDLVDNVLVWSDEVYRIFGLRPQEFGATYEAFLGAVHPEDREAVSEAYASSLREGRDSYEIEHRVVRKLTGEVRCVHEKCAHFRDETGSIIRSVGMVHDITDRKQFEQLLLESNLALKEAKGAAEKANLAKSEFLSSMSHELRTPLNAVLGFAQLMASDTPPPSSKQMQAIDQILRAGWYLLSLINEILDLATIESGKVTMLQETISLAEELQSCRAMVEPQASQRGIQIAFNTSDIPCHVTADRTRVKQVIINLLTNAIKYNRPGGSITVHCRITSNNRVRVEVADTGIGLSPQQMEQLFQPFNRLGQESGSEEGSGIGLFVSKQLIELMGGVIGVESKIGVGSVFWFELALTSMLDSDVEEKGDVAVHHENRVYGNDLPRRTLLYIEDNPANMTLVEQLIARRDDLKLLKAMDGHEGVRMACELKPDIILMDINLPGLNGYRAMEMLRENPETTHILVMALSANALPSDIEKGMEAGFFRYLTKPIKVVEFMDALDAALRLAGKEAVAK